MTAEIYLKSVLSYPLRDHSFSTYAKSYPLINTLTFAYQGVRNVSFRGILHAYFFYNFNLQLQFFTLLPMQT